MNSLTFNRRHLQAQKMEQSENCTTEYDTSWRIGSGDLGSTMTLESSLSLSCDDKPKSPLILYPPSPDSCPCEITIRFVQKHEVRQVYVRSSARVYEIYCAPELRSDNEYLCTVRCSVAMRDGEVMRVGDVEGIVSAAVKWSSEGRGTEKIKGGSYSPNGSEDEWVEVNTTGSFAPKCSTSQGTNLQDLYEATAEMNDTNPCMSLTLRLLSLQIKGCVWIDEMYVFADPVDDTSSENQVGMMGNSSGSSLMAMLLPTIFQLSKTKDVRQAQDIDTTGKQKLKEVLSNEAGPSIRLKQAHQDGKSGEGDRPEKLQDAALHPSKPVQLGTPPPVVDSACKPDMSHSHIEGALYHLASRVNRIEEMFLRFEENMLKPISSIDERLHRVEQQLEVLTKKSQSSELPSCNKISAPEFSCSESETNSYNNGSIHLSSLPCEVDGIGFHSGVSSIPNDSAHAVENTIHPSLGVSAPEFLYGNEEEGCEEVESDEGSPTDEEEGCQEVKSVKESLAGEEEDCQEVKCGKELLTDKLKKVVSIDDALACALAGFLTSTSGKSQKCSLSLAFKAPEFPDEEDNDGDETALPKVQSETTNESTCLSEPDRTEHKGFVYSSLSLSSSAGSEKNVIPSPVDYISQQMVESSNKECQDNNTEEGGDCQDACIEQGNAPETNIFGRNDSDGIVNDLNNELHSEKITDNSLTEISDSLEQFSGDRTDNESDDSKEGFNVDEPCPSSDLTEKSKEHILQNVVDFSLPASVVDFESPILDVKFISQESSNVTNPLAALLDGMPDVNPEVPSEASCTSDRSGSSSRVDDFCDLISVEDSGATVPGTDKNIIVDMNYCSLKDITPISESEKSEKSDSGNGNHDSSPKSLI